MTKRTFRYLSVLSLITITSTVLSAAPFLPVTKVDGSKAVARPIAKIGDPYIVGNKTFTPASTNSYQSEGLASWYGSEFHGRLTSNGEVFDENELTAAHTTLPMPSFIEVTNLENGKKLILRVNDRGPFKDNRIVDVSSKAAELLGFKDQGTAKVKVKLLPEMSAQAVAYLNQKNGVPVNTNNNFAPQTAVHKQPVDTKPLQRSPQHETIKVIEEQMEFDSNNMPQSHDIPLVDTKQVALTKYDKSTGNRASDNDKTVSNPKEMNPINLSEPQSVQQYTPQGVFVQLGAYENSEKIAKNINKLSNIGAITMQKVDIKGKNVVRLRVGPYGSIDDAIGVKKQLVQIGYKDSRVVIEE